jgi:hypothetical protein
MKAADVPFGATAALPCGCIGQRATAPVSAHPHFLITASCADHAPGDIVATAPNATVTAIWLSTDVRHTAEAAVTDAPRAPVGTFAYESAPVKGLRKNAEATEGINASVT